MKTSSVTITICVLTALLATGTCLQCERCRSATSSCFGPLQTCEEDENACLILTMESRIGRVRNVATYKGCTNLVHCPPGPFTITTTLHERIRSNSDCCCWDHCNKGGLRLPVRGEPNLRLCPGQKRDDSKCSIAEKLHCHGQEVNCFYHAGHVQAGVKNETFVKQGCGTKHTCLDKLGRFGIPGLFLETLTKVECSRASKIGT
ncbi:phospholipase A2 inhibitor and Ly6/PLAUR domain-containing protein-like [Elgaria multicarinata webbii]|uniref:phospholipase A2 inhibitor and Ly6/PLAUR domain-containing protein-like n=1 Tax=Elgaria multicarinata webbii TaxID=159646 RepID=UPI002FCD2E4B